MSPGRTPPFTRYGIDAASRTTERENCHSSSEAASMPYRCGFQNDGARELPLEFGLQAGAAGFADQPLDDFGMAHVHDVSGMPHHLGALEREGGGPGWL